MSDVNDVRDSAGYLPRSMIAVINPSEHDCRCSSVTGVRSIGMPMPKPV